MAVNKAVLQLCGIFITIFVNVRSGRQAEDSAAKIPGCAVQDLDLLRVSFIADLERTALKIDRAAAQIGLVRIRRGVVTVSIPDVRPKALMPVDHRAVLKADGVLSLSLDRRITVDRAAVDICRTVGNLAAVYYDIRSRKLIQFHNVPIRHFESIMPAVAATVIAAIEHKYLAAKPCVLRAAIQLIMPIDDHVGQGEGCFSSSFTVLMYVLVENMIYRAAIFGGRTIIDLGMDRTLSTASVPQIQVAVGNVNRAALLSIHSVLVQVHMAADNNALNQKIGSVKFPPDRIIIDRAAIVSGSVIIHFTAGNAHGAAAGSVYAAAREVSRAVIDPSGMVGGRGQDDRPKIVDAASLA